MDKPMKQKTSFNIDSGLLKKLKHIAVDKGISAGKVIEEAIAAYVDKPPAQCERPDRR